MTVAEKRQQTPSARTTRQERLEARVTKEQKDRLIQAAALAGRSLTDFIVSSADERARELIREHEVMRLSAVDSEAFAEALLADAEPGDRLQAAARDYRRKTGV